MRNLLLFLLLLLTVNGTWAQPVAPPVEYSQNEKLSIDAYNVFKTNKFLDFKDQDTLLEIIDGVVYKTTNLNRYFSTPKDWNRILAEDTSSYRRPVERYPTTTYNYSYTDTSMTESHDDYNPQYDLINAWKTVYNLKGFITYHEKNTSIKGALVQIRNTTNTFDAQNRVLKIVKKEARAGGDFRRETITQAVYAGNTVTVSSGNGTVICRFISSRKATEQISDLTERQIVDSFMYALLFKNFEKAKSYGTPKMDSVVDAYAAGNQQIEGLAFQEGTTGLTTSGTSRRELWKIKFTNQQAAVSTIKFTIVWTSTGRKIDTFKIAP